MIRLVQILMASFPAWTCLLVRVLTWLLSGLGMWRAFRASWKLLRMVMEMLSVPLLVSQISEFCPCFPACDMHCSDEENVLKLLQGTSAGMISHLQHLPQAGTSSVGEGGIVWLVNA